TGLEFRRVLFRSPQLCRHIFVEERSDIRNKLRWVDQLKVNVPVARSIAEQRRVDHRLWLYEYIFYATAFLSKHGLHTQSILFLIRHERGSSLSGIRPL